MQSEQEDITMANDSPAAAPVVSVEHDPYSDEAVLAEVNADIRTLLEEAVNGMRKDLRGGVETLVTYTAARTAYLSTLVGKKGFEQAVIIERDNVAIRCAIEVGRNASGADQRLIGIIQAVLLFGAKRLVAVL